MAHSQRPTTTIANPLATGTRTAARRRSGNKKRPTKRPLNLSPSKSFCQADLALRIHNHAAATSPIPTRTETFRRANRECGQSIFPSTFGVETGVTPNRTKRQAL